MGGGVAKEREGKGGQRMQCRSRQPSSQGSASGIAAKGIDTRRAATQACPPPRPVQTPHEHASPRQSSWHQRQTATCDGRRRVDVDAEQELPVQHLCLGQGITLPLPNSCAYSTHRRRKAAVSRELLVDTPLVLPCPRTHKLRHVGGGYDACDGPARDPRRRPGPRSQARRRRGV